MYTDIIFEDKGELQRWLGSIENFEISHPEATVLNIQENETKL
jgi:hypothetical protein